MRENAFVPVAVLAIAAVAFSPWTAAESAAAVAPSASPTVNPKKDPCGETKSKWAHKQCEDYNSSAPGDEYFGRMKMSYLGIDNTFKDGSISAGAYTTDPRVIAKLMFADDALERWAHVPRHWRLGEVADATVPGDADRLVVALDALLENAVRHTGSDDVIQLSVIRGWPGMPVRIVIADSGSGIAPDQLHLIFDRFWTGDDSQPRGTGLGLPLVRAVARAHGGDVTVRSVPGEGSEFELTLPEPASYRPELPAGAALDGSVAAVAGRGSGQQGSARG